MTGKQLLPTAMVFNAPTTSPRSWRRSRWSSLICAHSHCLAKGMGECNRCGRSFCAQHLGPVPGDGGDGTALCARCRASGNRPGLFEQVIVLVMFGSSILICVGVCLMGLLMLALGEEDETRRLALRFAGSGASGTFGFGVGLVKWLKHQEWP